jgi:transcription initiation factor IIE alpha subunit
MKKILFIAIAVAATFTCFAQKDALNKPNKDASVKLLYSCPMHPDVTSDKPGKCSKCGMDLGLSKKEQMKTAATNQYACPMHADMVSSKAGKCPKCGSALVASKKEQMKMEVMKIFSCPMHPDQTSNKAGKCPKCGMEMAKAKS